jgi:hypothetical protein
MPRVQTSRITRERLDEWAETLDQAHATPMLMVAVGHDEQVGEMHVIVPDGVDRDQVKIFLRAALRELS